MIIEEVVNGREVLRKKVEDFLPDLVFMDINLPEGNGLKLTRKTNQPSWGLLSLFLPAMIFLNIEMLHSVLELLASLPKVPGPVARL